MKPEVLKISEVARVLACSYWHARQLVLRGKLPAVDIGLGGSYEWRVRRSDLEAFLSARSNPPPAPATPVPLPRSTYVPKIVKL